MHILVTNFAETSESSGIGALGVDGKAFIIQLVTFVLAFWVLKKYAFKPIMKVLDERRRVIDSGVTLGEEMKKERAALEQKVADKLTEARQQADGILATAQDNAREVVREAEDKAKAKADGILVDAKSRIDQETARARQNLQKEMVILVSEATEAIIGEKVDAKKDASLIESALKGQKAA
jgi:F-type H+-transporting ATPase subunit b